jgi:DNA topoisomerase II
VKGDDLNVNFEVTIAADTLRDMEAKGTIESKLKLSTTVNKANMHLFDPQGRIKRYETAEQVLMDFFELRLEYYTKRKVTRIYFGMRRHL